jgi:hypothetical protein
MCLYKLYKGLRGTATRPTGGTDKGSGSGRSHASQTKGQSKGQGRAGCGDWEKRSSLLLGHWLLAGNENMVQFMQHVGGVPEEKTQAFANERQMAHFEPVPGDDEAWIYRVESEAIHMPDVTIKFGIERNEVTPFRVPAKALWTFEGQHKLVTRYSLYDGRTVKVVREVKPGKPNRMTLQAFIDGVTGQRTYTRI